MQNLLNAQNDKSNNVSKTSKNKLVYDVVNLASEAVSNVLEKAVVDDSAIPTDASTWNQFLWRVLGACPE